MAGQGHLGHAVGRVQRDDAAGHKHIRTEFGGRPAGTVDHCRGAMSFGRIGGDRGAHLPHHGGALHGVAFHVADDQRHPFTRQFDHVVPVTARLGRGCGRSVTRCGGQSGQLGERGGEQPPLEVFGDFMLLLTQFDAFHGRAQHFRHHGQDRPFLGREAAGRLESETAGADDVPASDEREVGGLPASDERQVRLGVDVAAGPPGG
jgi:hypothetical protein